MAKSCKQLAAARIARLLATEKHYAETNDDPQAQLRDVLTDLRHFADDQELDFERALDSSYDVYLEETHTTI